MSEQLQGEPPDREDPLVEEQSEAAAAEAGAVGGPGPEPGGDPAEQPLIEAGQGEAEGFEESERALEEQATHGDGGGIPPEHVPAPEQPLDQEFGEADEVVPAEGKIGRAHV